MTSCDPKKSQSITETSLAVKLVKSKSKMKGGANVEINNEYLDESPTNNYS